MATPDINDLEKWVQGADKKPKFAIYDYTLTTPISLSLFSGFGVIIFNPDGDEVGRYGTGMSGYSTAQFSTVSTTSFEIALDHSLNTSSTDGVWEYRIAASWLDSDFTDSDYTAFSDNREPLYLSVAL
jgi:hypothetical protein